MSQSLSPKGKKVFDYFVANPTANASKVAAKFKMSMSNVYKLKTSANSIKATAQKTKPSRLPPRYLQSQRPLGKRLLGKLKKQPTWTRHWMHVHRCTASSKTVPP